LTTYSRLCIFNPSKNKVISISIYAGVFKAITGRDDVKSLTDNHDWMVVIASTGTNTREHASPDSQAITAVKCSMQTEAISKQREWIKVRPVGGGQVDPRFERRRGYIHESLRLPS